MSLDHSTAVWFSKSYGLIYLMALFCTVVVYAYWPANKKHFDHAADSILHDEDGPWR